jgi:signal peptidase
LEKENKKLVISIVIIALLIGGSFGFFFILQQVMRTPIPVVVVTSGSMEPTINEGDILFIQNGSAENIKAGTHENRTGDIIVYETRGLWSFPISEPVVHRVIEKDLVNGTYYFITQGDANGSPDPYPIPENKVYGKVVGIVPKIGWVKLFLDRTGLAIPLIVILGIILLISIAWDVVHPDEDEKEENQEEGILDSA